LTNDVLVVWLEKQILRVAHGCPDRRTIDFRSTRHYKTWIVQLSERIMKESVEKRATQSDWTAFISHLTRYSDDGTVKPRGDALTVEDVIRYAQNLPGNEWKIFYCPPSTVSGEFMTEHRHWRELSGKGKPALPKIGLRKPSVQGLSHREAESTSVQVLNEQREVNFGLYLSNNNPLTMPAAVLATCACRSGNTPCRR
jgi:hypothetical protein